MKSNKFTSFFKHMDIFKKKKDPIDVGLIPKANLDYKFEIDTLLKSDNIEGLKIFIKSETIFNKEQIEFILFPMRSSILDKLDADHLDTLIKNNNKELKECFIKRISFFADLSQDKIIDKNGVGLIMHNGYRHFIDNYKNTIKLFSTPFGQKLFNDDMEKVYKIYLEAFKITDQINSQITSQINKNKNTPLTLSVTNFQNIHESYLIKIIVPLYNKLKAEQLSGIKKISKNVEIDAIKISIVNSLADQVNNFDINSLSSNAQETFKKINELCEDLETSKSHFTIQQSLHFENIVNKRLPQIIQEYIIIPEKYRKHLKHIEDSPDSLLEDSLKEIKNNLVLILEEVQINYIQKMKQSNIYLKNISF